MNLQGLEEKGWRTDENALSVELDLADESIQLESEKQLEEFLLNSDLHDVAVPALVNQLDRKNGIFTGPLVLQLTQWRNMSHSLISKYEKNDGICLFTLSDGHSSARVCQIAPIQGIDGSTPYGTKILLSGRIRCECGLLLLDNKNTRVLGGTVSSLVEKWKSEKFRERTKALVEAPKWVPFSKSKGVNLKMDSNFNAMKTAIATDETSKEEDEKTAQFNAERRARIEALDVPSAPVADLVEGIKRSSIHDDKNFAQQSNPRVDRHEAPPRPSGQSSAFRPPNNDNSNRDDRKATSRPTYSRGGPREFRPNSQRGTSRGAFNQRNEDRGPPRSANDGRQRNEAEAPGRPFDRNRGSQRPSRGAPRGGGSRGSGRGRDLGSSNFSNQNRQYPPQPSRPVFNMAADFPTLG